MVGIGGSGMAGLAAVLLRRGARVSGSDHLASAALSRLAESGARVTTQQTAAAVPPETGLLVASAAIPEWHPELLEARRRGIPVIKYARLLGALMARQDGIAVSGTHGKSTTTAWLTFVLRQAGLDPSFVVGAEVEQLSGGSGVGDGPHFVAEACEYDRSFLNLRPRAAVILNIEEDHLDCYENLAAITRAFEQFAQLVPPDGLVVLNGQDPNCRALRDKLSASVETFGTEAQDTWRAADLNLCDGRYEFLVFRRGQPLGRVHLGIPGEHNVRNALAVSALASRAGVPWAGIRAALHEFQGAQRRLQVRSEMNGVTVVDDYAHHPTEIQMTLRAARQRFNPRRLWCVFQPHQHSRTRFLLADFARSFELADHIVVPRIYFVRDSERERQAVRATDLVEQVCAAGGHAVHIPDFGAIVETLVDNLRPGDLVITMGAGNIWKVADELVQRLRENRAR
ncbi:MAG: UDP-N-acetylmuramate--L-alanine ligase [Phycisphaerae bacterium]